MAVEFKLPEMGEGVNEGELVKWLVKEGDTFKQDQPLVEMMTDKATVEIPASNSGKVVKILAKEGDVVKVGQALLSMEAGTVASTPTKSSPTSSAHGSNTPEKPTAAMSTSQAHVNGTPAATTGMNVYPPPAAAHVLATPSTRRYAREAGVDINQISGSGALGRVTRDDVLKATATGLGAVSQGAPAIAKSVTQTTQKVAALKPLPTFNIAGSQAVERKPFKGIRKKIAENLVKSKQIIPHFTHGDEVDVTELVSFRTQMKEKAAEYGVKLTYLPFVMKALAVTCREFMMFNTSLDDEKNELVTKHFFNIGFAADTPEGLLVPNVKNVESKTILQIAKDISDLAEKARAGKLAPDDMRNGTITITNIGSIGGNYATPIINHPEVAIIGIYEIVKKPVVINDEVKIRPMMNITATCDHRVIDGADAARFLKKLKDRLANPQSLLLEMI